MKLKRSLSVVMIVLLLLSLVACSHTPTTDTASTTAATKATTTTEAITTVTTVTEAVSVVTTEPPATTVSQVPSITPSISHTTRTTTRPHVTRTLPTTVTGTRPTYVPSPTTPQYARTPLEITFGKEPLITDLNFGGATFTFADYGSMGVISEEQIAAFQTEHNVNLTVKYIPTDTYLAELVAAKASGNPYDIVHFRGEHYPEAITSGIVQPLEKYINTADFWLYSVSDLEAYGGFCSFLSESLSLNGHAYAVGGNYRQPLSVIYYNKKVFASAGYIGANDPLALYNAGKWNWQTLYDMLYAVQQPDKGIYGINAIAPCYTQQFLNSYNTDLTKTIWNGQFVENLSDPKLFEAYEMLQKYCYGENKVTNPRDQNEPGQDQFLNGETITLLSNTKFYKKALKEIPKSSAFDKQLHKLGIVPVPSGTKYAPDRVWEWEGFGAGAGASEQGVLCALMFAKHDSKYNHSNTYTPEMPGEFKRVFRAILDNSALIAPYSGFNGAAGNLSNLSQTLATAIALDGHPITVALKGYKKVAQTIIDVSFKG